MLTVYGIHGETKIFMNERAAQEYLLENYQEHYTGKDSFIQLCENMIWEDDINNTDLVSRN